MKSVDKACKSTPMPILYYYPKKEVFAIIAAVSKERSRYAVGIVLDEKDVVLFETTDKKEKERIYRGVVYLCGLSALKKAMLNPEEIKSSGLFLFTLKFFLLFFFYKNLLLFLLKI